MLTFKGVVPFKVYQTHLGAPMNIFGTSMFGSFPDTFVPLTFQPHDSGFLATDLERATAFLLEETDSQTTPARNGCFEDHV